MLITLATILILITIVTVGVKLLDSTTKAIISAEKQFLFRDSHNRGYVQIPRMIVSCLCLSEQAKMVYTAISLFVYEQGRSAFPSVHRMSTMCGMSAKSIVKYIKELEDKGFIEKVRRGNGMTNDYYIVDLHEVRALQVSEMVWKVFGNIVDESKENVWEQLDCAWKKYMKYASESGLDITSIEVSEETMELIKKDLLAIMEGGEPEMIRVLKVANKTRTAGDSAAPTDKGGRTFTDRHESEWRLADFRRYFYQKYRERTGLSHVEVEKVHAGIMSRILKQLDDDKTMLKRYIDAFFEIGYDNPSLEVFGTSGRFAEIATYIKDGKKPFYVEVKSRAGQSKAQNVTTEQQHRGIDEDEFIKRLKGEAE